MKTFTLRVWTLITLLEVFQDVAGDFPLDDPVLNRCTIDDITGIILQQCVNKCKDLGHFCGNRLYGGSQYPTASGLSCANGCEIAFYRATVDECKADCTAARQVRSSLDDSCELYQHPNIKDPFRCGDCQVSRDSCSDGCDQAALLPEYYYRYVEPVDISSTPRFLFGGQSNMCGHPEMSLPGSFKEIIRLVNLKEEQSVIEYKLTKHLDLATSSKEYISENEARFIYKLREHLKEGDMFNDHPTTTCSFTNPSVIDDKLDCERPLSSTACGYSYGPEFMFGHVFPKLNSPFKGKAISIAKVAVGGTEIFKNWSKRNKDEDKNYWYSIVDTIKATNGTLEGFVWFQGENDSFDQTNKETYLGNLTEFVADVRQEIFDTSTKFSEPAIIPVIICELGSWIAGSNDPLVIHAQKEFVARDLYAKLVHTGAGKEKVNLSSYYHYDAASQLIIGKRIAGTMAKLLRESRPMMTVD